MKQIAKSRYTPKGFLDMQVNGFMGNDYSSPTLSEENINSILAYLASSGTAYHVPTIVTSPKKRILNNIQVIMDTRDKDETAQKAIVGLHIEGPFISPEDGPRGAHDLKYVRDASFDEVLEWQEAAKGLIRIVTIAPEIPGALDCIEKMSNAGIIVAIGHTAADPSIIQEAVQCGARLSTHLGNGSHGKVNRLKNYIWEQLADDRLYAGIICDGFHLPEAVVKVIARAKGLDKLVLVSDVALLGGYDPGLYKWGDLDVEVFGDGHLGLPGTTFLAGAGHLLDWNIQHFMRFTKSSLDETIALCTTNPRKLLCLGEDNDSSVEFTYDGSSDRLQIHKTVLGKKVLFEQ